MPATEIDLAALEDRVASEATARLRARLEDVTRAGLKRAELLPDLPENGKAALIRAFVTRLNGVLDEDTALVMREAIRVGLDEAYRAGIEQAAVEVHRNPADFLTSMPGELRDLDGETVEKARAEIKKAAGLMSRATSLRDVEDAFAVARRSVSTAERNARWGVNRGVSSGVTEVATSSGARRLWIAERDACVHCLAYSGLVAKAGDDFPGGRTFGAKPLTPDPVPDPPLHPNCRCRIRVWRREDGDDYPAALQREALRSVLRGWSLPSESERTRLAAADRLLKRGADMPKSVQDYARRAIRQGRFPRGRDFPDRRSTVKHSLTPERTRRRPVAVPVPTRPDEVRRKRTRIDELPRRTTNLDPAYAREDARLRSNPGYLPGSAYSVNCVHVVATYELRRRGYEVTASPLPEELFGTGRQGRDSSEALSRWRVRGRWINPHGEEVPAGTPGAVWIEGGATRTFTRVAATRAGTPSVTDLTSIVRTWPIGGRGWIVVRWKSGGGHIFNVENTERGPVFTEAQSSKADFPVGDYLRRANLAYIVRVDDLDPTDGVTEFVNE